MKKIMILLLLATLIYAQDYSKLIENKKAFKKQTKVPLSSSLLKKDKYANYIQVIFYDPAVLDTDYLNSKYQLSLKFGIADGVFVFEYGGGEILKKVIEKIKTSEKNIKNIRKYGSYNLKTF